MTVPAPALAVALFTTRVGRDDVTNWPPVGEFVVGAESVTATALTPCCVIATADPLTVSVPVRSAAPVFAATVNCTVPLAEPDAPCEMVMKLELLVAVHAQPLAAVTAIVPVPPSELKVAALGAPTVTVQVVVAAGVVGVDVEPQADARHAPTAIAARKGLCIIRKRYNEPGRCGDELA